MGKLGIAVGGVFLSAGAAAAMGSVAYEVYPSDQELQQEMSEAVTPEHRAEIEQKQESKDTIPVQVTVGTFVVGLIATGAFLLDGPKEE